MQFLQLEHGQQVERSLPLLKKAAEVVLKVLGGKPVDIQDPIALRALIMMGLHGPLLVRQQQEDQILDRQVLKRQEL